MIRLDRPDSVIQSNPDLMESTRWSRVNDLVLSCTCAQIWPAQPDPPVLPLRSVSAGNPWETIVVYCAQNRQPNGPIWIPNRPLPRVPFARRLPRTTNGNSEAAGRREGIQISNRIFVLLSIVWDLIWVDSRGRGIGFSSIPSFVVVRVALFMMPCCSSSLGSRIRSWLRDYDCLQSVAVVLIYVQVSNSGSLGFLGSNNRWLCIVYFDLCSCDLVGCFVGFWWMLLGLDVGLFEVSIYIRFSLFVTNWFNWLFTGWR